MVFLKRVVRDQFVFDFGFIPPEGSPDGQLEGHRPMGRPKGWRGEFPAASGGFSADEYSPPMVGDVEFVRHIMFLDNSSGNLSLHCHTIIQQSSHGCTEGNQQKWRMTMKPSASL
jgi:hypothetical protein